MSEENQSQNNSSQTQKSFLHIALAKAQSEMKEAVLDRINPAFKSRYASLPSVLRAVVPPLSKNDLSLRTYGIDLNGKRFFRTELTHGPSGEKCSIDCPIFLSNNPTIQAYGSQQTYAMRYNIVALMSLIADEEEDPNAVNGVDDDGNAATADVTKKPENKQMQAPPPENQRAAQNQSSPRPTVKNHAPGAENPPAINADDLDKALGSGPSENTEKMNLIKELVDLAEKNDATSEQVRDIIARVVGSRKKSTELSVEELHKVIKHVKMISKVV